MAWTPTGGWDVAFGATPANTQRGSCPENGQGHTEIHIGGDIAFLAYQRWMATHDVAWLKETGWPLVSGVARYYASRATPVDNASTFGPGCGKLPLSSKQFFLY